MNKDMLMLESQACHSAFMKLREVHSFTETICTFVLEKVAHLDSSRKDKLCSILNDLCLLLWWDGNEPFCQADLALPTDKKKPIYLSGNDKYMHGSRSSL